MFDRTKLHIVAGGRLEPVEVLEPRTKKEVDQMFSDDNGHSESYLCACLHSGLTLRLQQARRNEELKIPQKIWDEYYNSLTPEDDKRFRQTPNASAAMKQHILDLWRSSMSSKTENDL